VLVVPRIGSAAATTMWSKRSENSCSGGRHETFINLMTLDGAQKAIRVALITLKGRNGRRQRLSGVPE
jgi:hypothetical protein